MWNVTARRHEIFVKKGLQNCTSKYVNKNDLSKKCDGEIVISYRLRLKWSWQPCYLHMWKIKVVSSLHRKFSSQEKSWYFNGIYNYWLFLNTWHHLTEKNCCRTYHLNPWAFKLSSRSNQMDNQAYFDPTRNLAP